MMEMPFGTGLRLKLTATVRIVDNGEQEITATVDGKEFTITEASVRRHLQLADVDSISVLPTTEIFDQLSLMGEPIPNVPDEALYEEWDDKVERATTTAASLDAEIGLRGYLHRLHDSPLLRGNTLGSDKGSMPLQELTVLCTTLSKKIEILEADLKQTKQVYGTAYTKLIMKVKKLEKTDKTSHSRRRAKIVVLDDEEASEDSSKQGRMIEEIDQDAGVTLVTPTQGKDQPEDQLGVLSAAKILADVAKTNVHTYTRRRRAVSTGSGGISIASRLFSTAEESVSTTGASMPVSIACMVQEVNISIPLPIVIKDKGKGKMEESKDEQIKRIKLQQEQDRLGHEVEEWENIRARVKVDEKLSRRLQAEERNKYSEVDQAKMLVDLINQRKKYFAAQKAKVKRNKPMTQAQQRNYMINYIKHMGSHTLKQLKRYSFDELKELFETTMKNVNTFVPMETKDRGRASKLAAGSSQATITDSAEVGSSKRAAEAELDHEGSKRQKTNEALESIQEQPDEEEKELSNIQSLTRRDDLVMLWSLVKERFSSSEPTNDKERALWVELKRLFEPNIDDTLWKLQRYMHDSLKWRLYDTCGVHHVSIERGIYIFMLVEKEYPLSKGVMTLMLVNRLLVEQHSEMENELLRKIFIQANRPRQ
ncbi:hypothetical protein Tco_0891990 [Tanacetum coccineum]|uniref:Uncharacterized protein n=1 Tax=Tanacetum coccineum TaxID=301880 RepID=A0ABQ5C7Q8_9ASTR